MKLIISMFFVFFQLGFSQSKDPNEILNAVITNFNKVNDYQVDVNIKVDVEFIKVPETKAKIYFKQPDKVHLEADGFAMLPKNGMEFSPSAFIKKDYTAIYEQDVDLNGYKTSIVKVIPLGDQGEVILSTLWIDQKKQVIRKVESTTKTNGTFSIDFSFDDKIKYPLPSKIIFSFNMDKMNIPSTITGETTNEKQDKKSKNSGSTTKGQVIVNYSNYVVNKGISDSIFEDKGKKNN
ncbi:MAG: outer membrane lipoprotein-sorting protein [Ignavibacterium sp.]|nr:outer membrane lipoprotein-sorting protein [Ignavibacterium sp.]